MDTSFLIDYLRDKDGARDALEQLQNTNQTISVTTPGVMELLVGIELARTRRERDLIEQLLQALNVLPFDLNSARKAAAIEAKLTLAGEQVGLVDVQIAAIAIVNNEALLTRNGKHFKRIPGLSVEAYA